jgi:uncharacterized membrane protein
MSKGRLEAFSDGVIAIIITIMVLELQPPHDGTLSALRLLLPKFLSYILSFMYLGIYWNNHHHLLQATKQVNGRVLWANLHLLFWLSLIPFVTAWIGETELAALPLSIYGAVLWLAGFAFYILAHSLIALHGKDSVLATALGDDFKGKISLVIYTVAILLSFVNQWIAFSIYVFAALIWFIPDTRIEKRLAK